VSDEITAAGPLTLEEAERVLSSRPPPALWRTGTKNPHTLYQGDAPRGFVLDPEAGARIVQALNRVAHLEKEHLHACGADEAKLAEVEQACMALSLAVDGYRQKAAAAEQTHPKCVMCGKLAACLGSYESDDCWEYSCNECCGHGNEDGVCFPLSEIPARYQGLLTRLASPPPPRENTATTRCRARAQDGKHYPDDCSWCEDRERPSPNERARALVERADRGEGRHDVKVVVEFLRRRLLGIQNVVDFWSASPEEPSDTPAFEAMSRIVQELAER
jgi:hypothetical protein